MLTKLLNNGDNENNNNNNNSHGLKKKTQMISDVCSLARNVCSNASHPVQIIISFGMP